MDPNANVREQIALLEVSGWTAEQVSRYLELRSEYHAWRARGGFPADAELLAELRAAGAAR
jgi:hypothetical protein